MSTPEIIFILTFAVFLLYWGLINFKSWLNFYFDEFDRYNFLDYDDYIKDDYNLRVTNFVMKIFILVVFIFIIYTIFLF